MSSLHKDTLRALLILLLGTVCISFAAIFVKMIDSTRVGPTSIAFWRTLFGTGILIVWTFLERRSLRLPTHVYKWSVVAGFVFFLDLFFWHRSIFFCGAGMATILAGTQVFASALLSHFFFHERLTLKYFLAATSGILGVALLIGLFSTEVAFSATYIMGIIFGLATGLTYANYIISVRKGSTEQGKAGTVAFMAWTSFFTMLFTGAATLIEQEPFLPPDTRTWVLLFALGLIPQAIGWRAISSSLPKLAASSAALVLLLQSVLATLWGMLIFGERLTFWQIVGAIVTLTAIYFGSVRATVRTPADRAASD